MNDDQTIEDLTQAIQNDPNNGELYVNRGKAYVSSVADDNGINDPDKNFWLDNMIYSHWFGFDERDQNLLKEQAWLEKFTVFKDSHRGYKFMVKFMEYDEKPGYFCGYVKLPKDDKFYNVAQIPIAVHGSSFSQLFDNGEYWIGWDYDNYGYNEKNYELIDVIKDCCSVIMQLFELNETKDDLDRAIEDCNQAISLDPNDASAYTCRGNAYNKRGNHDRAIENCDQAIRLDSNYAWAYISRSQAYIKKRDFDRAIENCTQAINLTPNDADAFIYRGVVYITKGDRNLAIEDFTQAIRVDPNNVSAYINRGNAYKDRRKYEKAIADFETALRIDPNNEGAKHGLVHAQQKLDLKRRQPSYKQKGEG